MEVRGKRRLNIFLTALFVALLVIFIITFSIGVPIYFRFFYYIQIKTLKLEQTTGWDYETIKTAYDDILNYCTMAGYPCKTGALRLSQSAAAHFADCKKLFNLNLSLLVVSGSACLTLILLNRFKVIGLLKPFGHRPQLLSALIAIALPAIILLLALIAGFDNAFAAFHKLFFPGKSNWLFNPEEDEIIKVMPEQFFMNSAIIIAVSLSAFASALILADYLILRKEKKGENMPSPNGDDLSPQDENITK